MHKSAGLCVLVAFAFLALSGIRTQAAEAKRPATADRHKEYGVKCDGCHGAKDKKLFDFTNCFSCHESYGKVAERTKKLARNPHKSHYGDLECNACHHGHKPDENFCAQCHQD